MTAVGPSPIFLATKQAAAPVRQTVSFLIRRDGVDLLRWRGDYEGLLAIESQHRDQACRWGWCPLAIAEREVKLIAALGVFSDLHHAAGQMTAAIYFILWHPRADGSVFRRHVADGWDFVLNISSDDAGGVGFEIVAEPRK